VVGSVADWDHAWERALDLAWDAFSHPAAPHRLRRRPRPLTHLRSDVRGTL